jgi:hypothetical protein
VTWSPNKLGRSNSIFNLCSHCNQPQPSNLQAAQFFGWGVTTYYGGVLVVKECMKYNDVYLVTNAIVGGAGMIGYSFAFTADFNKALLAASRVFVLLDRKSLIDGSSRAGLQVDYFWIFYFLYVRYSTLLQLPPFRFHCVGGCWDRTQDCCDFGILQPAALTTWLDLIHTWLDLIHSWLDLIHKLARFHPHLARSHPLLARSHPQIG